MLEFIRTLQNLDRRIVYVVIAAVLSIPFLVDYSLPIHPDTYTKKFYDTIEEIAADPVEREKVVLVLTNWGPGTSGENDPQFQVIMRHLLRRDLKFIFLCSVGDPVFHDSALLAFEKAKAAEIQRAQKLEQPIPEWIYGEDYLDFGYKNALVFAPLARAIIETPREFFRYDFVNKKDLTDDASYPLLERYQSIDDVSAVLIVSAADESKDVAGLVKSAHPDLKVAPATMGIVANDLYPYVKSGQLFGLLNSARAASEYRALLDPEEPSTKPLDNSMSAGKMLLLALVILGNIAFVVTRRAERTGQLPPPERGLKPPLPPLPAWFMWGLFALFAAFLIGSIVFDYAAYQRDGALARHRVARVDDDPNGAYGKYERVDVDALTAEAIEQAVDADDPVLVGFARQRAQAEFNKMIEVRIGEYLMVLCTLGVFAFCLGDNRFYRFTEAIIIGGSMAYLLDQVDKILIPDWLAPVGAALTGGAPWYHGLWILLAVPGALWYFTYSKRYRWLNQLIVALFIGLAIGPEFEKQISLVVPQIMDSIQPIWPWTPYASGLIDPAARIEHLFFLLFLVLSLTYFIFFFRPKGAAGNGLLTAGRLAMMVGFGAMFGNTVNTRLSWLAPRFAFLWEDWLFKLGG